MRPVELPALGRPHRYQAVHGGQVRIDRVAVSVGLAADPGVANPLQVLAQGIAEATLLADAPVQHCNVSDRTCDGTARPHFAPCHVGSRPHSVLRKHSSDLLQVVGSGKRQHEQDARFLRIERIGGDVAQFVILLARDNTAVSGAR
jgi:hypothetical protein